MYLGFSLKTSSAILVNLEFELAILSFANCYLFALFVTVNRLSYLEYIDSILFFEESILT